MPEKWLKWENGKEWGTIYCPMLERNVMTYWPGGPVFDTYTAPFVDKEGDICYYKYDHDYDGWDEDTLFCLGEYKENVICRFADADLN